MKKLHSIFDGIDLVVFDLDGTLIDSKRDICESINAALTENGERERPEKEIERLLYQGGKNLVRSILGDQTQLFHPVFDAYQKNYEKNLLKHSQFYPGARLMFENLLLPRKTAVLSNKREKFCKIILEGLEAQKHFVDVLGGDSVARKPSPKALNYLCQRLKIAPEKVMMIGDSPVDVEAGRAAGTLTIALKDGFCSAESVREAGADLTVGHLSDLFVE